MEVSEGTNLSAIFKRNVLRAYRETGRVPSNRKEAGASPDPTDTFGKFVASVDIVHGSLVVTYGRDADQRIAGKRLTLVISPYETFAPCEATPAVEPAIARIVPPMPPSSNV